MNVLRIYANTEVAGTPPGRGVFYSHRAGGPYYRWCFEKESGQWRFSRVHPSGSALKALRVMSLKDMPTALRVKLDEHYSYV
jgi:hypothetical protein